MLKYLYERLLLKTFKSIRKIRDFSWFQPYDIEGLVKEYKVKEIGGRLEDCFLGRWAFLGKFREAEISVERWTTLGKDEISLCLAIRFEIKMEESSLGEIRGSGLKE